METGGFFWRKFFWTMYLFFLLPFGVFHSNPTPSFSGFSMFWFGEKDVCRDGMTDSLGGAVFVMVEFSSFFPGLSFLLSAGYSL